ncbi:MAG: hypothetical protein A3G20_02180 [Acidobacteria bacterium RIFCSPLOWO2_12_FULL_59_11]|nr:MAG: hypothetical protein A3G20_02180 [Acidobacteria bacterium RIFCSPLOWO2_12_FULL_59_11]
MVTIRTWGTLRGRIQRLTFSAVTLTVLGLAVGVFFAASSSGAGQSPPPGRGGVLSGKVTADKGPVRAVRVRARDTVHRITYTVFTNKGSYRIFNVPAGTYEVSALQEGLESTIQTVELKPGETRTADVSLSAKPPARKIELVDYDSLYPPGRGRDVFMKECAGCHGLLHIPLHRRGPRSEEAWRAGVNRMFEVNRSLVPVVSPDEVSVADREVLVQYFNDNFGADSTQRDLKLDEVVLDEAALAQAIYVEYDLPPVEPGPDGKPGQRGTHDVFPSQVSPTVWMVDTGQSSILGMDLRNPDYPARFREWRVPATGNAHPHGLIEARGKVYWSELAGGSIGELDPATGAITRYPSPSKGALHTLRADSRGNVWYTAVYGASRIGRLDAETKTIKEWDPSPSHKNAHYYGIVVDKKDRVWATGSTAHIVVSFDPKTGDWKTFPTPTPVSGPRRPTLDSKGRVWFSEHAANALAVLDPETGKITEYKSPLRYSGEYESYADADNNIWLSLRAYGTLARFDQRTEKYTFFPYPENGAHTPKIETDSQGTLWFAAARKLVSLKPKGNVPRSER